uniref:Uncharacterized protein n=1 Tax=Rhizophora mucronata TaxID=61149 RepID=A0A2P2IHA8_RHIMU
MKKKKEKRKQRKKWFLEIGSSFFLFLNKKIFMKSGDIKDSSS